MTVRMTTALLLILLIFLAQFLFWTSSPIALNLCLIGLFIVGLGNRFDLGWRLSFRGAELPLMQSIGFLILAIAGGLVLVLPGVDGDVSISFYQNDKFILAKIAAFVSHNINRAIVWLGLLGAVVTLLLSVVYREAWFRRLTYTFAMFALAQILLMLVVVHEVLKPFFSRSRPRHIVETLEAGQLDHWWVIGTQCLRNCSMPSGEASAGFACLAAALAWNRGKFWPSMRFTLVFGFALGFLRVAGGAHFASDVVMSAVFMLPLSYALWIAAEKLRHSTASMLGARH